MFKAVLFDLDGTLLDSFPAHFAAYEIMFGHFGIEVDKERFLATYSPNWYRTYQAFGLEETHWELANSIWLEAADQHLPTLVPGSREVLDRLAETYELGIVTSGSESRVSKDLLRLGIDCYFDMKITGDDITHPKPDPEGLRLALRDLSVAPNEAVYVGDAADDFEMARAAGVRFYGVPSEFANLEDEHAEYQVRPIIELPDTLEAWKAAASI